MIGNNKLSWITFMYDETLTLHTYNGTYDNFINTIKLMMNVIFNNNPQ